MYVNQTAKTISTYAGDTSGVCSALYELGGMIVMHDPSGCNSTYSTHDEPRWYDTDSMIFISGLTEKEAIFGDDQKLISDVEKAAKELKPRFIAIAGTPIPYMLGFDYTAVAAEIECRTNIPTFGFNTNGMHSYIHGASMAFSAYTERFCTKVNKTKNISVNILGTTPFDFSVNGSIASMRKFFTDNSIEVNAVVALECGYKDVDRCVAAHINIVVSSCGLESAKILKNKFGIPYIIGTPYGNFMEKSILAAIDQAIFGSDVCCYSDASMETDTIIIGESITSLSLASSLKNDYGINSTVISAVDTPREIAKKCICKTFENDLKPLLKNSKRIIADPLYKSICPQNAKFIPLPHEAFSGRIYRSGIPNLVCNFDNFIEKIFN